MDNQDHDHQDETANCFVPEMLVDFINKNLQQGKEGIEPASFFINGVCLLVDISGFTKLSGDFCGLGKSGIDELQLATNGYMGKLVEIVYTFGGEIIKFAGDAIICVFSSNYVTAVSVKKKGGRLRRSVYSFQGLAEDDLGSVSVSNKSHSPVPTPVKVSSKSNKSNPISVGVITAEVVLRAMRCAHVLRAVQTEKLTVHVAMSCGEMCFGILGGVENRWECLISGPCIHELSDCLDDAPSKEAAISPGCGEILKQAMFRTSSNSLKEMMMANAATSADSALITSSLSTEAGLYDFSLQALPSGNYKILDIQCVENLNSVVADRKAAMLTAPTARNPELSKLIRQFVPLPIAEELDNATGLSYLAEIREVTTMFMKWDSYDADGKHRDLLQLQACFYQAQRILHSTGAYLRQFLVDDKGCVLIGCWGMPHLSYLDNAHRALSAAAQIKYELNKLDMMCSFGITTGDVYCGTVGSALRMEYAAIGSVVNMSARLMCKANGGILVDDTTYSRMPSNVVDSLKKLDPIKVKGRDEPLQVYSYIASGSIHVREKVVEDHEISAVCKTTLLTVVDSMVSAVDIKFENSGPGRRASISSVKEWISGPSTRQTKDTGMTRIQEALQSSRLPIVLIQGKDGSGRTTVVVWLKKQAVDRQLQVLGVKVSKKDSHTEFIVWKKLFQQLMPKDLFLSNETQRQYVRALLKEVFPGAPQVGKHVGFPVLKAALGITCAYSESAGGSDDKGKGLGYRSLMSRKIKPTAKTPQPVSMLDTLYKIFAHLLNVRTALVIVENMEHADEESLKLLLELTKLRTRSVIVITALLVEDKSHQKSKGGLFQMNKAYQLDAFHSTPWSKQFKDIIFKHRSTIPITLENYTPEEIDRMLSAALGVREVPPEISQLVQDFSGGSYFWVREILQFIKEHGPELFMSAVNDKEGDANAASSDARFKNKGMSPMVGGSMQQKHTSVRRLDQTKSFHNPVSNRANSMHSISVSSHANNHTHSQLKLDKLVLCRFENLHSDVQHVLRTASIIGVTFSAHVLYGVLPRHLKDQMSDCIKALLNQRWLYQDTDNESLYQFAHPHSHQIIYELTPSSERAHQHQLVADYIEETCGEDKAQFAALSYHYQHCDTDKALQYCVKATAVIQETDVIFDFGDCLDLLFGTYPCCKSSYDVDVLLKLVMDTKNIIEHFDLSSQKAFKGNWLRLFFAPCTGGDHGAVSPHDNDESGSDKPPKGSDKDKDKGSDKAGSDKTNSSLDSELSAKDYEKRAKRIFLEQLDSLNDQLCEKYVELVDSDAGNEAKDWQRELLGLSNKEDGVLARLVRGMSTANPHNYVSSPPHSTK